MGFTGDTIYVIQGMTGYGDSYKVWLVCSYRDRKLANKRIRHLNDLMFRISPDWSDLALSDKMHGIKKIRKYENGDPHFDSYGMTEYFCIFVKLF